MADGALPEAIEWCPKAKPKTLHFNGTACILVAEALAQTFGKFPIQLNQFEHATVILGMMHAAGEGATPYKELLDALNRHGEIEVRLP